MARTDHTSAFVAERGMTAGVRVCASAVALASLLALPGSSSAQQPNETPAAMRIDQVDSSKPPRVRIFFTHLQKGGKPELAKKRSAYSLSVVGGGTVPKLKAAAVHEMNTDPPARAVVVVIQVTPLMMGPLLDEARKGAESLIASLGGRTEVGLVTYTDVMVDNIEVGDPKKVLAKLSGSGDVSGADDQVNLPMAIDTALKHLEKVPKNTKENKYIGYQKAVVVIGMGTSAGFKPETLLAVARRAEKAHVPVHTVRVGLGMADPEADARRTATLRKLSKDTRGTFRLVTTAEKIGEQMGVLEEEMTGQAVLSFDIFDRRSDKKSWATVFSGNDNIELTVQVEGFDQLEGYQVVALKKVDAVKKAVTSKKDPDSGKPKGPVTTDEQEAPWIFIVIGIVGVLVISGGLVWFFRKFIAPPKAPVSRGSIYDEGNEEYGLPSDGRRDDEPADDDDDPWRTRPATEAEVEAVTDGLDGDYGAAAPRQPEPEPPVEPKPAGGPMPPPSGMAPQPGAAVDQAALGTNGGQRQVDVNRPADPPFDAGQATGTGGGPAAWDQASNTAEAPPPWAGGPQTGGLSNEPAGANQNAPLGGATQPQTPAANDLSFATPTGSTPGLGPVSGTPDLQSPGLTPPGGPSGQLGLMSPDDYLAMAKAQSSGEGQAAADDGTQALTPAPIAQTPSELLGKTNQNGQALPPSASSLFQNLAGPGIDPPTVATPAAEAPPVANLAPGFVPSQASFAAGDSQQGLPSIPLATGSNMEIMPSTSPAPQAQGFEAGGVWDRKTQVFSPADLERDELVAWIVPLDDPGMHEVLVRDGFVLGSGSRCDLIVQGEGVLPEHAKLDLDAQGYMLRSAAVGGEADRRLLMDNDRFRVGPNTFLFKVARSFADEPKSPVRLEVMEGVDEGRSLPLQEGVPLAIGSHPSCALVVRGEGVGDRHALVFLKQGMCYLEDLGQERGLTYNGGLVGSQGLHPGEELVLGSIRVSFVQEAA